MPWKRILRNMLSNWTSYLVTAVVGFLLTPVVVHSLGNTGYGLWTLVLAMTGYFGLLDLGIRSSVGRFVTRYLALNDEENINRTASAAFVVLACAGALAIAATVAIAVFFFDSIRIEPEYVSAGRLALVITGINMGLALPFGVFSALLFAMERFDVVSGITIVSELIRAAAVVWCLQHGYGLIALALVALGVTVIQYTALAWAARSLYPRLRIGLPHLDRATVRALFGFSIFRFIWIVANQLIFYSDSLVIGIYLGASAITPYAIAVSLINYGRNIVSLVTDTLGPTAARMDAHADLAGLQRLLILGTKLSLFVAFPVCLGFVFFGRQFITLWMGKAYAGSALYLILLTIPQIGSMSQYASAFVLAGIAKHRALAYFALAEGVANLALSIYLVQRFGLVGVAWGTIIPHLICTTIVIPLYTLRVLHLGVGEYIRKAFIGPTLCAVPIALLGYVLSRFEAVSWAVFAGEAASICALFALMAYFVCLDGRQRASVTGAVGVFFHRGAVVNEA